MLYLCFFKPLRHYLRGFLIAAWAGDKIAEFSFPEISFHFPLRPWFFCKPRVCGEKSSGSVCMPGHAGSPPRMRGKGYDVVSRLCRVRITPACAGKSTKSRNAIRSRWDHPRMCGEKNIWVADVTTSIGSPPHVRGKGVLPPMLWLWPGITPACAGKRTRNKAVGGAK